MDGQIDDTLSNLLGQSMKRIPLRYITARVKREAIKLLQARFDVGVSHRKLDVATKILTT